MEYTQPDEENSGDFKMNDACQSCRICLITRPEKLASGKSRYHTAVWVMSDDGMVRLQQKGNNDPKNAWSSVLSHY